MKGKLKKSIARAIATAIAVPAVLAGCVGTEMMLDSSGLTPSGDYLVGMIASDIEGASAAVARAASADPVPGSITQSSNLETSSDTNRVNSADRIWSRASLTEDGTLDVGIFNTTGQGNWERMRTDTADIVHDVAITGHDGTPLYGQQLGKSFSGDAPSTVWASVWSNAEATDDGRLIAGVWAERRELESENEWTLGAFANGPDSARTLHSQRGHVGNQLDNVPGGATWTGRAAGVFMEEGRTYEVHPFIGSVSLAGSIGGNAPWIEGELSNLIKVNLDGTGIFETEWQYVQVFPGYSIPLPVAVPDFLTESSYTFERAGISDRPGGFFTGDVTGSHDIEGGELDMSGRWGGELYGAVGQHVLGTFAMHGGSSQWGASMIGTFGAKSTHHFHEKVNDMLRERADDGYELLNLQAAMPVWHNRGTVSQHDGSDLLSVSARDGSQPFISVTDAGDGSWGRMDSYGIVTLEDDDWGPSTSNREFARQIFYKVYDHDRIALVDARSIKFDVAGSPHVVLGQWAEVHGFPSYSSGATGAFAGAADEHRAPSSAVVRNPSLTDVVFRGDAWGFYSYKYGQNGTEHLHKMEAAITMEATRDSENGRYKLGGRLTNVRTSLPSDHVGDPVAYEWTYTLEDTYYDPNVTGGPSSGTTDGYEVMPTNCIWSGCHGRSYVFSSGHWGAQFYGDHANVLAGTFGFEGRSHGGDPDVFTNLNGSFVSRKVD